MLLVNLNPTKTTVFGFCFVGIPTFRALYLCALSAECYFSPPQLLYGKSRVLDVLVRVSSDPTVTEDGLVDLLLDVLADERQCSRAVPDEGEINVE